MGLVDKLFRKKDGEATALIDDTTVINHGDCIEFGGYWAEHFKAERKDLAELSKTDYLNLMNDRDTAARYVFVSLNALEFMPNLKEAIIQYHNITDWEYLSCLSVLRQLCIAFAEINSDLAGYIAALPKLRELFLTRLKISDFETLSQTKATQLTLHAIEGLNNDCVRLFTNLTRLDISAVNLDLSSGVGALKKLKKLKFENAPICNLAFLENLKNLEAFSLSEKTDDTSISEILPQLKKLKEFEYPLRDLSILRECPQIETIHIDGKCCVNFEALQGTDVSSVMVIDADTKESAEQIIREVQKYCKLRSYGYREPSAQSTY